MTIPHKEAALALADDATETAKAIGAANTLTFEPDGRIHADNTDATGFLTRLKTSAYEKTALVLGAGGSARAILYALQQAGRQRAARLEPHRGESATRSRRSSARSSSARTRRHRRQLHVVGLHDPAATFKELPLERR